MFTRYPYQVEIFEKRGNSIYLRNTKARRIRKGNEVRFKLHDTQELTKPIDPKYIYINNKKKHCLKLYMSKPGVFFPIDFNVSDQTLNVMDEDTRRWIVMDEKETFERYKNKMIWWKEYFPIIAMAVFGIVLAIIIYVSAGYMENIAGSLGAVASSLEGAVNTISNAPLG